MLLLTYLLTYYLLNVSVEVDHDVGVGQWINGQCSGGDHFIKIYAWLKCVTTHSQRALILYRRRRFINHLLIYLLTY